MKLFNLISTCAFVLVAGTASAQTGNSYQETGRANGAATQNAPSQGSASPGTPSSPMRSGEPTPHGTANQSDANQRTSVAPAGVNATPSKIPTKQSEGENASAKSAGETTSGPAGRGGSGEPRP